MKKRAFPFFELSSARGNSRGNFLSDSSGATAIEFAMISVPLLGLIGALFETGSFYFKSAQLQLTTESASRTVLTRTAAASMTYKDFIEQNICSWKAAGGTVKPGTLSTMFDCDKVMVDISSPTNWGAGNVSNDFYNSPPARTTVINMPAAGKVAVVRIAYPASAISSILTGGVFKSQTISQNRGGQIQYSGNWTYMLLGVYAFRVEP